MKNTRVAPALTAASVPNAGLKTSLKVGHPGGQPKRSLLWIQDLVSALMYSCNSAFAEVNPCADYRPNGYEACHPPATRLPEGSFILDVFVHLVRGSSPIESSCPTVSAFLTCIHS
jgi:hypothetical protein